MKTSAGILFYRTSADGTDVVIVHPSGSYNTNAKWSIPKGELDVEETAQAAALRESLEEIAIQASPENLVDLGDCFLPNKRKRILCFACRTDDEPSVATWEIDQAKWFNIEAAREVLHPSQHVFLDKLKIFLA